MVSSRLRSVGDEFQLTAGSGSSVRGPGALQEQFLDALKGSDDGEQLETEHCEADEDSGQDDQIAEIHVRTIPPASDLFNTTPPTAERTGGVKDSAETGGQDIVSG